MKVDALHTGLVPPPAEAGAAQAARWRQALEAAMWQARPAPQPAGGNATGGAASEPPSQPAASTLRPVGAGPQQGGTLPARFAGALPSVAGTAPAVAAPVASPALQGGGEPAVPAMPAAAPAPQRPATAAAAAEAPPRPAPWPQLPFARTTAWPAVAGQACVQGDQVSASLRDARLTGSEADALRRALERRLAGSGLRLAELRVNGQLVTDTPTDPPSRS